MVIRIYVISRVKIELVNFSFFELDDSLVCLWEDNEALFENVNRNIIKSKLKHIKPFECYKLKLTVSKYKIEFIGNCDAFLS